MTDPSAPRDSWRDRLAALEGSPAGPRTRRREPITTERIVDASLRLVETEGFDALTMRRLAAALQTGPASLYAHVRNKADLDDLLLGQLCAQVRLPAPEPARWREQFIDVCRQLRDQYLRYPGISRAALTNDPSSFHTLGISEGMLAILLAGGVEPRPAAWAMDAAYLYVSAYSLEASLRHRDGSEDRRVADQAELVERFQMLPSDRFPHLIAHAWELTSGEGHQRFDFTLEILLEGLAAS